VTGSRIVVRRGGASLRVGARSLGTAGALAAMTLVALATSVALGEFPLPPLDVLASLVGAGGGASDFIVLDLRLPRALTALLAGAAFGLAGAAFQQVTRNPLVAPDVVGVSGGASLAAVALIVLASPTSPATIPLAALAGALATGAALYALAWCRGVAGYRLVLVGIGVAAFMQAGVSYVLTQGRIFEVAQAYVWLVGSVNGRGWEHVWALTAALALLAPVILGLGRRLDALQLGDEVARSLGVDVERSRVGLLAVAVALTGVTVSATGPIGFVAFVAPHIARRLSPSVSSQSLLPMAAGCGALLVLLADLCGRLLFAPTEIPVGLITSIVAAPYFLALLHRANRIGAVG
jgi:iron complex transport system permease protein